MAGRVAGAVLAITVGLEGTAGNVGVAVTVGLEEGISAEWGISTGRYGDKVADLGAAGLCGDSLDKSHLLGCIRLFLLYLHSVRKY